MSDIEAILQEVGRKFSRANEGRLRQALDAIEALLQQLVGEDVAEAQLETDTVPLQEGGGLRESTALLKLIRPGWGSSGYYPANVLRQAASIFKSGTKMFWNHPTAQEEAARPEGDLDRLAAQLTEDATWRDDGPTGPGLYARAKVFERFARPLADLAQHIGVSIRAAGKLKDGEADGRRGPIVERITAARSVDFVTQAGAGGEILQLFEAAGRAPAAFPPPKEQNTMDQAQVNALIEAAVAPLRTSVEAANARATAAETKLAAVEADNVRVREAMALQGAEAVVVRKLKSVQGLPQITKDRLAATLPARATLKEGRLDEAALEALVEAEAKSEATYLQAAGVRVITGMGSSGTGDAPAIEASRKVIDDNLKALRS